MSANPEAFLRDLFACALAAGDPTARLPALLPAPPRGRTLVLGAGKAAAAMARAIEDHWRADLGGLVVTRYGHALACRRIEVVEAGHPVPDENGVRAARRMLELARSAGSDDLVLCPISGGGSALLPAPIMPLTLQDEQEINRALLTSGASIGEMNCVRRHVSQIKGGRLAAACHPAQVVTLLVSDVPGDDPADIASGPTVPDATTCADALAVIERHRVEAGQAVLDVLRSGRGESVKPGDVRLAKAETRMTATPRLALEAAAERARLAGVEPYILADDIEGEARDVGKVMAALARNVARRGEPFRPPCVLLSGGETTVTVRGGGRGGRNVEFLLSLAIALDACPNVYAIACDTDGVDGTEEIAGAVLAPDTLARARALGLDARQRLAANDGHAFFGALGDSVVTGPTLTNVNDFRAIFVGCSR